VALVTLSAFLLARIAEDEDWALDMASEIGSGKFLVVRMRAECAAKRRIIALHDGWPILIEKEPEFLLDDNFAARVSKQIMWTTQQTYREQFGDEPPTTPMLRALASVYADHPDFREEWRV
jgi:hypothetical protein